MEAGEDVLSNKGEAEDTVLSDRPPPTPADRAPPTPADSETSLCCVWTRLGRDTGLSPAFVKAAAYELFPGEDPEISNTKRLRLALTHKLNVRKDSVDRELTGSCWDAWRWDPQRGAEEVAQTDGDATGEAEVMEGEDKDKDKVVSPSPGGGARASVLQPEAEEMSAGPQASS